MGECKCPGHRVIHAELAIIIGFLLAVEAKQLMQIYGPKKGGAAQEKQAQQGNQGKQSHQGNSSNAVSSTSGQQRSSDGQQDSSDGKEDGGKKENRAFQWYRGNQGW